MWSAQVGKTTLALCAKAYKIVQDPQSQIMMQPSQGDLGTWLETKFNPLVESNPEMERRIAKPRAREGVNNSRMKSYPGGFLMFSWSGSAKTTRGRSAPFVVTDETDGYERGHEGHPVSLLWQRAATFGDRRKLLEISTPTIKGASWIEASFEQGDQRFFYVPCVHCGHEQKLQWKNVIWDEGKPETAKYGCENCGSLWSDAERYTAIRGGHWTLLKQSFQGHASFHLPS
jgi:Bacteriophage tail assembly protein